MVYRSVWHATTAIFAFLFVATSHALTSSPSLKQCEDSKERFVFNNRERKCGYLNSPSRIKKLCKKNPFIGSCPKTCESCGVCADTKGKFSFKDGTKQCSFAEKKPNFCSKTEFIQNCPETCNLCDNPPTISPHPSNVPSGMPSGHPTTAPSEFQTRAPSSSQCEDSKESFIYNNKKRRCGFLNNPKKIKILCKKHPFINSCYKTCESCGACADTKGKFPFKDGQKQCSFAVKKPNFCSKTEFIQNCRKTCNLCTTPPTISPRPSDVPSDTPTDSPTRFPTVTPSSSPSVSPTRSPTVSPTVNPTIAPTPAPTTETPTVAPTGPPQCNLVGKLWFPEAPESNTFRIERLFVTKAGRTSICSDQKDTTWGCTVEGDAKIYQNKNEEWKKKRSIATLSDAFGFSYKFTVQHIFDDREKEFEINAMPVLTITVNGVDVAEYNVNGNKRQFSHDADGYANSKFKDHTFVDVSCDDDCVCTPLKSMPICPVRVEVRMPKIDPELGTPNTGYHRETMSVNLNGSDESCSPVSANTKWCTHEGKAEFYRPKDASYYEYDSISTTESIVIPEALGKSFDFKIKHIYDDYEIYYPNDHTLNGDIVTFVGGKKKVFKRDIDKDTHIYDDKQKDWIPNPEYDNAIFLQLVCDDGCDCTIEEVNTSGCQLTAKLKFPNFNNMVGDPVEQDGYYGYHNDFLSIQKQGEEEECYYGYSPKWGCSHEGDARFWFPDRESFTKHTEEASIADGSSSHHRFSVNHYYDKYYGEKNFPKDQMKQGVMQLTVNNMETKSFSHPYNEVEPRFDDGRINPDYKGKTYVDVTCDSECECDIVERVPGVCEIDAVLAFPPIPDGSDYYGYHESGVFVSKKGEEETCGYYYPLATWGCSSTGQAYNSAYDDDAYKGSGAQEVNIVDATNSSYTFHMKHYYSELREKTNDHKIAELDIKVNGASIGQFKRPDVDFDGTIKVKLACDKDCSCAATV